MKKGAKMEWISVEERLPDENSDFITYCADGVVGVSNCGFYGFPHDVTHWMPLPPPPSSSNSE